MQRRGQEEEAKEVPGPELCGGRKGSIGSHGQCKSVCIVRYDKVLRQKPNQGHEVR